MNPTNRALRTVALFAVAPAVILGVVGLVVGGWIIGLVVLIVVAGLLGAWSRFAGDGRSLTRIGGRQATPGQDPRLCNLVEGLSINAGVKQPNLRVIDSPGLNAIAVGTSPGRAVLGVTTGLLTELDRMELEAVLAEELIQIRHNETFPGTVLVATFGIGRGQAVAADRDASADQGAVTLTRYPPALASALEKIEAKGPVVSGQPAYMAHLWLADPRGPEVSARGRISLRDRIEALREL